MRILIVEDDAMISMMIEEVLGDAGHEVIGTAESASSARDLIERNAPELLLVDIHLADGETGCDLAAEADKKWQIPTVFITGSPAKARVCDRAIGVLAKPFHPDSVTAAVRVAADVKAGESPAYVPQEMQLF